MEREDKAFRSANQHKPSFRNLLRRRGTGTYLTTLARRLIRRRVVRDRHPAHSPRHQTQKASKSYAIQQSQEHGESAVSMNGEAPNACGTGRHTKRTKAPRVAERLRLLAAHECFSSSQRIAFWYSLTPKNEKGRIRHEGKSNRKKPP